MPLNCDWDQHCSGCLSLKGQQRSSPATGAESSVAAMYRLLKLCADDTRNILGHTQAHELCEWWEERWGGREGATSVRGKVSHAAMAGGGVLNRAANGRRCSSDWRNNQQNISSSSSSSTAVTDHQQHGRPSDGRPTAAAVDNSVHLTIMTLLTDAAAYRPCQGCACIAIRTDSNRFDLRMHSDLICTRFKVFQLSDFKNI